MRFPWSHIHAHQRLRRLPKAHARVFRYRLRATSASVAILRPELADTSVASFISVAAGPAQ